MRFESYRLCTGFVFSHSSTSSELENILNLFESHPESAQALSSVLVHSLRSFTADGVRFELTVPLRGRQFSRLLP